VTTPGVDISVVIVNRNTADLLAAAVGSVYDTAQVLAVEVWVVDNASNDHSVAMLRERFARVRIIENDSNRGFGAANNQALRRITGRYALLLNSDAALTPGAARRLFDFMEASPSVGMACGQLLNPDGSRQNSFANFPDPVSLLVNESLLRRLMPGRYPGKNSRFDGPTPVDSCIGACMIVRASAMTAVGRFDERYFFFMEETDWALQFHRAGWQVMFVPDARIVHAQGRSAGSGADARILFYRSRYQYLKKWHRSGFPLLAFLIVVRLVIDVALNLVGAALTLGLVASVRHRFLRNAKILLWHVKGCP